MNIDLRDYYPILNECTAYLKGLKTSNKTPSKTTINQYKNDVDRMDKNNQNPQTLATTKNTFYKYRAGWSYIKVRQANKLKIDISNTENNTEKVFLIKKLKTVIDQIKLFEPDPNNDNFKLFEQGKYSSKWQEIKEFSPKSKSKKYQKITRTQLDKYFDHVVNKKSKYVDSIAILSVSGCRPSELEDGIFITLNDDNSIKITIESKKTHKGKYGQQFRSFNVKDDTKEFNYMVNQIRNNKDDSLFVQVKSAKNLGSQMQKYSKQAFSRMKIAISPYTFRHQFGRKVKSCTNKINVAIALGHSNDKSQRYYANASNNTGGFSIDQIEGTRDVKEISQSFNADNLDSGLSM